MNGWPNKVDASLISTCFAQPKYKTDNILVKVSVNQATNEMAGERRGTGYVQRNGRSKNQ